MKKIKLDIKLVNIFQDDHLPCCDFIYNGEEFSLWWTEPKTVGAFEYPDSSKASSILKHLKKVLDKMILNKHNAEDDEYQYTDYGFLDYGFGS